MSRPTPAVPFSNGPAAPAHVGTEWPHVCQHAAVTGGNAWQSLALRRLDRWRRMPSRLQPRTHPSAPRSNGDRLEDGCWQPVHGVLDRVAQPAVAGVASDHRAAPAAATERLSDRRVRLVLTPRKTFHMDPVGRPTPVPRPGEGRIQQVDLIVRSGSRQSIGRAAW